MLPHIKPPWFRSKASPDKDRLCRACQSLKLQQSAFDEHYKKKDLEKILLSGSLYDLHSKQQGCALCRLILHTIERNVLVLKNEPDQNLHGEEILKDHSRRWQLTWGGNAHSYENSGAVHKFRSCLYPGLGGDMWHHWEGSDRFVIETIEARQYERPFRARVIEDRIDIGMIGRWIRLCREWHGPMCSKGLLDTPRHPSEFLPFMVIDVHKQCLVPFPRSASSPDPYTTLSYVWGNSNHLLTLLSNVNLFSQESAFLKYELPATIRDAIDLTQNLGFRYLWVDSLCITQDDVSVKSQLIDNMDAVYGNSALTIVAGSGHGAHAGLPGFGRKPPSRIKPFVEELGDGLKLGVLHVLGNELESLPHAQRGWTYQETVISPRCLVFSNAGLYFSCREAFWREDYMAELKNLKLYDVFSLGRTHLRDSALGVFGFHLAAYSKRHLTYNSDAVDAFAGILKALSPAFFNNRTWYGMPGAIFDRCMLWGQSSREGDALERRREFPSWSWAGASGGVFIPTWAHTPEVQDWLLQKTWVVWYIIENGSSLPVPIWDPVRDAAKASPLVSTARGSVRKRDKKAKNHNRGQLNSLSETADQVCPSYGLPIAGNPYGRQVLQPASIDIPSPVPLNFANCISRGLKPGTLCFSTLSLQFQVSAATYYDSDEDYEKAILELHDKNNDVCGTVEHFTAEHYRKLVSNQGEVGEILLISYASPGNSLITSDLAEKFSSPYRSTDDQRYRRQNPLRAGDSYREDFFNAMLIVTSTDMISERVGIGLLHPDAVQHAIGGGPQWRDVYLW